MFPYEERIKAVKLLLQYDMSYSTVIRELGYPSKETLWNWYKPKFSEEEKQRAVNYYLEHGRSVSRTVKKLGYPSRPVLDKWILELATEKKRHCSSGGTIVKYTREQEEQAVISLCSRSKPAKEVAVEHGTTRETLNNWKRQILKEGRVHLMNKNKSDKLKDTCSIEEEVSELRALALSHNQFLEPE
jgi:transposase-like protein